MSQSLFKARLDGEIRPIFKDDEGNFVVWGPASVEVVDKENDLIRAEALREALPQLLKRKRVSLEHSDQLVGDILEAHEVSEPVEVEIGGETLTRKRFPTAVLDPEDGDDVPEKGLYVASKIFGDTRQAREVREGIERGEYSAYSISGESIKSTTKIESGTLVDDIKEMDLSAVTICEEGMNQRAEFGIVSKLADAESPRSSASAVAKGDNQPRMTDNESGLDPETLRKEVQGAAEEVLPEGELATKEHVNEQIDSRLEELGVTKMGEECEHGNDPESCPMCDGDEKAIDDPETQDAINTLAENNEGLDPEEVRAMVEEAAEMGEAEAEDEPPGEKMEGEEEDEDEMDEGEMDEDDNEEESEEDTEEKVAIAEMKSELPDDLYDAVSKQLGLDNAGDEAPASEEAVADAAAKADDEVEKAVATSLAEIDSGASPLDDAEDPYGSEADLKKDDEISAEPENLEAFHAKVDN